MRVLVTGGTGYIGSHTTVLLAEAGHEVVILDNLINSQAEVVDCIAEVCGRRPEFYRGDILDEALLDDIFAKHCIDAVIHFAGLKAVGESVQDPLRYYHNNVGGTAVLTRAMQRHGCQKLVFSSSATVYGDPDEVPIPETARTLAVNPYGSTKLMIERMLTDWAAADSGVAVSLLRYFNPVGAHPSGLIGESPSGVPNNLMPYITQVAVGALPLLRVFGSDYPTPDGTGVRDYLHVMDLAQGHLCALDKLGAGGVLVHNLGTGRGVSVLEMVRAFERATGVCIPYELCPRRPGDIAECYADPGKAQRELGWQAKLSLEDMCADAYRYAVNSARAV